VLRSLFIYFAFGYPHGERLKSDEAISNAAGQPLCTFFQEISYGKWESAEYGTAVLSASI